ncbi:uncharacterized protein LOC136084525 isoform X1 [Hydra vulgaris]|uniref:Uncharacterized protein LOC136084525 isoform X1 n=1 Tax=Hydra vulgaris TaxID=6087 RepID=A0ABM4CG49_HYDVU
MDKNIFNDSLKRFQRNFPFINLSFFPICFVHLTITMSPKSFIKCIHNEKFLTLAGELHCKLSCQCPSDTEKAVRIAYVGCKKCCCTNIQRITKVLQETTERLGSALLEKQNLTEYYANLKKISEEKAMALHDSNKGLESALYENQNLNEFNVNLKKKFKETVNQLEKKISALIITIYSESFVLLVIMAAIILIVIYKNRFKKFIFRSSIFYIDLRRLSYLNFRTSKQM